MSKTKKRSTRITKSSQVLEHLRANGTITSWEAINLFGATRLSAIIYNLRKHYDIRSTDEDFTDRNGNRSVFAKYIYFGKKKTANA